MAIKETQQQQWDRCFRQGKKYENEFLKCIKYDSYEFSIDGCKEYDIKTTTNGIDIFYEIKSDNISYNSGNLCVEYSHKNEPSGINITIADYWANFTLIDTNKYILYLIPTYELKQLIIEKKKFIKDIKGGYNRNAGLYLISLSLLEKYIVTPENINK